MTGWWLLDENVWLRFQKKLMGNFHTIAGIPILEVDRFLYYFILCILELGNVHLKFGGQYCSN